MQNYRFLEISEKFEQAIYLLDNNPNPLIGFKEFQSNYLQLLNDLNITQNSYLSKHLSIFERMEFLNSYVQMSRWLQALDTDNLNNIQFKEKVVSDVKLASIKSMDILSTIDTEHCSKSIAEVVKELQLGVQRYESL